MTAPAKTALSLPQSAGMAGRVATRIVTILRDSRQRRKTRLDLARLDDRLLRDIGVDPLTAQNECSRHFWQG